MTPSLTCSRSFLIRLASVWLAVLILSACQPGGRLTPLDANSTVLAFGDSLTYGTGVSADNSYPEVLNKMIDARVVRSGVPGEVSSAGLNRLRGELERTRPDLVLLCHGGNDILRRMAGSETKRNLTAMIDLSREFGAEVAVVAVPNLSLFPKAASYYADLESELDVPVEYDVLARLQADNSKKSDPVHFNGTGYREFAEAVHELLEAEGAL